MSRQFELPGGYYATVVAGADGKMSSVGIVVGAGEGRVRGERKQDGGREVKSSYGMREWAQVDITMLIVFVYTVWLAGKTGGERGLALHLLFCRLLLSVAVLNRARLEFFVAGVTAAWTAVGLYERNYDGIGCLMAVSFMWLTCRAIMVILRTLVSDAIFLNKLLAYMQGLSVVLGVAGMLYEGFSARVVVSNVLGVVTVVYLYRLRRHVYACESAILYMTVCFFFPDAIRQVIAFFAFVEMVSLREFTSVAVGERFRQVVRPSAPVMEKVSRLTRTAAGVAAEVWRRAEVRVDRVTWSEWMAMGQEEKGAKSAEIIRKYALVGDKMLALALEVYAFRRKLAPSIVSSYRQTLLTNRAFAGFFDAAYGEVFPRLLTRSVERKGTCVEAVVGVSVDSLAQWTESCQVLNLVAESLGFPEMMNGEEAQGYEGTSFIEDSTFKIQDLKLVSDLAGAAVFGQAAEQLLFGGGFKCDRQMLKQLSRVGRAAMEAQIILSDVDSHNVTVKDMTLFVADYLSEDVVSRTYVEKVCVVDERRDIKLSAKTLAENMFALIGISMIRGEYERVAKLCLWYCSTLRKVGQGV